MPAKIGQIAVGGGFVEEARFQKLQHGCDRKHDKCDTHKSKNLRASKS